MLQEMSRKFRSGCVMLMRDAGAELTFLGSAFLVHREGYLLTAAHLVNDPQGLVVVATSLTDEFAPMTFERVAGIPVAVARADRENDTALLRIEQEVDIGVPDDFLGATESVRPGATVMSLGYSFGHEQLHTVVNLSGVVAAKVRSPNNSRLVLFDKMVHDGDRGGPLVHVGDGHVVGVVSGRFEPAEVVRGSQAWDRTPPRDTSVSYAVAIEYGIALMQAEGLLAMPSGEV
jgi:serine protease Do